jgi:hypothetical protein
MKKPKMRVSATSSVQAPVGGLDDTSPISNMSPDFALEMVNWFPEGNSIRARGGYRHHVDNLGAPGKAILAYNGGDTTFSRLFVATDVGIYDISIATDAPALVHPLTDGNVQWIQFSNIAGNFLIGCNGVDPAFLYNGTTWTDFVASGTPTVPGEIDGLDPSDIVDIIAHKSRIWFVEKNTMDVYYWPTSAVAGLATPFPMGGIFTKGGSVNTLFTWTMDAGYSIDDLLIIQSTRGELASYAGIDPDTDFRIVGRYEVGAPLGRKSNVSLNGDTLLMTEYGLVPMSKISSGAYVLGSLDVTASGRISQSLSQIIRVRMSGTSGWELVSSPALQYVVLSVPEFSGLPPLQYIMNSLTGAWTTYNLPAETFLEYDGMLYFCDNVSSVYRHGDSDLDNVGLDGTGGTGVIAGFKQAYNYFDSPNINKHYKLVRPIFESINAPSYNLNISVDFGPGDVATLNDPGPVVSGGTTWDSGIWDSSIWSPQAEVYQQWIGVLGTGYSASMIVKVRATTSTRFVASHWAFENGVSL